MAEGSSKPARTRLEADQRRGQLIQLGLDLLADRPLEEISVEEIARRLGVSNGLLFHYFPTKRAFQVAVSEAAVAKLLASVHPDPGQPPIDQLRAGLTAYVEFVRRFPHTYVALLRGGRGDDSVLRKLHLTTRSVMARMILAGFPPQQPTPPLVEITTGAWLAFVEEATVEWLADAESEGTLLVNFLLDAYVVLVQHALEIPSYEPSP